MIGSRRPIGRVGSFKRTMLQVRILPGAYMSRRSWSDEDLKVAIEDAICWSDVARNLGLDPGGRVPERLRQRANELDIDYSHFDVSRAYARGNSITNMKTRTTLNDLLTKGERRNNSYLKKRLIEEGLIDYECEKCGISKWNDEPLTLHLDHIDGDSRNNKIDNLRLLCPNCHSQTDTFGRRKSDSRNECKECGQEITNNSTHCKSCAQMDLNTKANWPSDERLAELVWEKPVTHIAEELGVSDKAVSKRCKIRDIETPGRGYWQKKQ